MKWIGLDVDLLESLKTYGMICCKTQDSKYMFWYYDQDTESYQKCEMEEKEINNMYFDMSYDERVDFLSIFGLNEEEWVTNSPIQKVSDLLMTLTIWDIFGVSYTKGYDIDYVMNKINK